MKIIDIHTHVYPDAIAEKAAGSIREFYQTSDNMDGTVSTLLRRGSEAGISRFVILPVAIRADRVQSINHFITETAAGNNRFIGFGTLHAAMETPAGEGFLVFAAMEASAGQSLLVLAACISDTVFHNFVLL